MRTVAIEAAGVDDTETVQQSKPLDTGLGEDRGLGVSFNDVWSATALDEYRWRPLALAKTGALVDMATSCFYCSDLKISML